MLCESLFVDEHGGALPTGNQQDTAVGGLDVAVEIVLVTHDDEAVRTFESPRGAGAQLHVRVEVERRREACAAERTRVGFVVARSARETEHCRRGRPGGEERRLDAPPRPPVWAWTTIPSSEIIVHTPSDDCG